MNLTAQLITVGTGATQALAEMHLPHLQDAFEKFEINTPARVAALLANVGVETASLSKMVEDLNYSAQRLAAVWPHRFAEHGAIPNNDAMYIQHNPRLIADAVYGGRFGNVAVDDGWNYRARGYIGTTFRDNYAHLAEHVGYDILHRPDLLAELEVAAECAAYQFVSLGCCELADAGEFDEIVKHINGQLPCSANQGALRRQRFKAALGYLHSHEASLAEPTSAHEPVDKEDEPIEHDNEPEHE